MPDQFQPDASRSLSAKGHPTEEKIQALAPTAPATEKKETISKVAETAKLLTAEEQMELYEKDLKENDWGHQPC